MNTKDLILTVAAISAVGFGAYYVIHKSTAAVVAAKPVAASGATGNAASASSTLLNSAATQAESGLVSWLFGSGSNSGQTNSTSGSSDSGLTNNNNVGGDPGGTGVGADAAYYENYFSSFS